MLSRISAWIWWASVLRSHTLFPLLQNKPSSLSKVDYCFHFHHITSTFGMSTWIIWTSFLFLYLWFSSWLSVPSFLMTGEKISPFFISMTKSVLFRLLGLQHALHFCQSCSVGFPSNFYLWLPHFFS